MKRLNFDMITKVLILLSFAAFFLRIILSGEIRLYVHPRIIPFVIFAMLSMFIISLFFVEDCFKISKKHFKLKKYNAFIIPLVLIAFFEIINPECSAKIDNYNTNSSNTITSNEAPDKNNSTNSQSNNTTDGNSNNSNQSNGSVNNSSNNEAANSGIIQTQYELYSGKTEFDENGTVPENKLDTSDGAIEITLKNYVTSLDELLNNPEAYDGQNIEISGFIYRSDDLDLADNQFIIGRYIMVCCAADMQIAGLRCQCDKSDSFNSNAWIKIKGKIKNSTYENASDPLILVDEIEYDPEPDTSYVYPY